MLNEINRIDANGVMLHRLLAKLFAPPPKISTSEWAKQH